MKHDYMNLLKLAAEASKNAYAPYSKFKVGAVTVYESGKIYSGCNVENVSYGLSLCAERNAIASAIASGEKSKIECIAIYSPNQKECLPCGACRQWMAEFASKNIKVVVEDNNAEPLILTMDEIFPNAFLIKG